MSLFVTPSALIRLLNRLFKLTRALKLSLSETIGMDIDALEMMKEQVVGQNVANLSAAATWVVTHTVPKSERWYTSDLNVGATTGAKGGALLRIKGKTYSLTCSGTGNVDIDLVPFFLEEGDTVEIYSTGNGSDTGIGVTLVYQKLAFEGN